LLAAIILHALLLSWSLPASKSTNIRNGLLHVDLLKAARPAVAQSAPASPPAAVADAQPERQQKNSAQVKKSKHQQTKQSIHNVLATELPSPKPAPVKMLSAEKKPLSIARHETETSYYPILDARHVAASLPVSHGEPATPHASPSMAANVQSMLLANIHYPAQARRHGWQGAGEFQLDIDSQSIRNITMLVSTGHAILDRAARLGLVSVNHVPVANGQYRLPVEFRLQ